MIPHNHPNQILKFIAYATDRGHVPTWQELEVVANFRERGGLLRCLEALSAVAAMELAAKKQRRKAS